MTVVRAAHSAENYRWLADYGRAICAEYTYRYDKVHSCQAHIEWLSKNEPPFASDVLGRGLTPFAQAVPDWIKDLNVDAVTAYRLVYIHEKEGKIKMTTFKKRERPAWLSDADLLAYSRHRPADPGATTKSGKKRARNNGPDASEAVGTLHSGRENNTPKRRKMPRTRSQTSKAQQR